MDRSVEAIFENGVLRPLEELSLRPKQRVTLHIDELPADMDELEEKGFLDFCRAEGDPNISLEEVRKALAVVPGTKTEACSAERDED